MISFFGVWTSTRVTNEPKKIIVQQKLEFFGSDFVVIKYEQ